MIKNKRMLALLGAGAMLMSMMFASTASADGQISWDGKQGLTDGALTTVQCNDANEAYILWVFTPGGGNTITGGTLTLGGSGSGDYPINDDNGQWKATTPFFDLATLTATLNFQGDLGNGNSNLVISHGCPGTQESQPPSEGPSFSLDTGGETDAPSEPSTDAFGNSRTSGPADGAWLLVVALGVLLASIVVLTPARAKSRR